MSNDAAFPLDMAFPFIASRLFGTPLLIAEDKLDVILSVMAPRMGFAAAVPAVSPFVDTRNIDRTERKRLAVTQSGVAVIDVVGTLAHETNGLHPFSGITPYQGIAHDMETAENDSRVRALMFRFHSPGGEANAVFDLADAIRALKKPTAAIIADMSCSAAYMLASACQKIFITQNAQVGSIGVIAKHIDRSGANTQAGLKVTTFFKGPRKADFSEPVTEESAANIMRMIDSMYMLFCTKVAEFRGLSLQAVMGQESKIFHGVEAIANGLADEVKSESEALAWLSENAGNPSAFTINANNEDGVMNRSRLMGGAAMLLASSVALAPEATPAPVIAPKAETPEEEAARKKKEEEDAAAKANASAAAAVMASATAFATANPSAFASIESNARAAERDRIAGIRALCVAGEDAMEAAFIAEGTSVADAGVALANHRRKAKGATLAARVAETAQPIPAAPTAQGVAETIRASASAGGGDPLSDAALEEAFKADAEAQRDFGDGPKGLNAYRAWRRGKPPSRAK